MSMVEGGMCIVALVYRHNVSALKVLLFYDTSDCPSVSPSSFPPILALSLPIAYALLVFVTFAKYEVIWSLKAGIYCEISPVD